MGQRISTLPDALVSGGGYFKPGNYVVRTCQWGGYNFPRKDGTPTVEKPVLCLHVVGEMFDRNTKQVVNGDDGKPITWDQWYSAVSTLDNMVPVDNGNFVEKAPKGQYEHLLADSDYGIFINHLIRSGFDASAWDEKGAGSVVGHVFSVEAIQDTRERPAKQETSGMAGASAKPAKKSYPKTIIVPTEHLGEAPKGKGASSAATAGGKVNGAAKATAPSQNQSDDADPVAILTAYLDSTMQGKESMIKPVLQANIQRSMTNDGVDDETKAAVIEIMKDAGTLGAVLTDLGFALQGQKVTRAS